MPETLTPKIQRTKFLMSLSLDIDRPENRHDRYGLVRVHTKVVRVSVATEVLRRVLRKGGVIEG